MPYRRILLEGDVSNPSIGCSGDAGEGATLTLGTKYYVSVAEDFTINEWQLRSGDNTSGDIEFDVWKKTGGIPTALDSICNGNYPSLSSQTYNSDTDISDWSDLSFTKGDVVCFYVRNNSTLQKVIFAMIKAV